VRTRSRYWNVSVDVTGRNPDRQDRVALMPAAFFMLTAAYAYNANESASALLVYLGRYDFGAIIQDMTDPSGLLYGLWNSGLIDRWSLTALMGADLTPILDYTVALYNERNCDAQTSCSVHLRDAKFSARPDATLWLPSYELRLNTSLDEGTFWSPFFVPPERDRCAVLPSAAPPSSVPLPQLPPRAPTPTGALPTLAPTSPPPLLQRQSPRASNGRLPNWVAGPISVVSVAAVLLVACALMRRWSTMCPHHKPRGGCP